EVNEVQASLLANADRAPVSDTARRRRARGRTRSGTRPPGSRRARGRRAFGSSRPRHPDSASPRWPPRAGAKWRSAAEEDVLRDDAVMTVIGSGTSLEGDRWVLGRDVHDGFSYTYLDVETPNGH